MILILGGTTEGRVAVRVADEASRYCTIHERLAIIECT